MILYMSHSYVETAGRTTSYKSTLKFKGLCKQSKTNNSCYYEMIYDNRFSQFNVQALHKSSVCEINHLNGHNIGKEVVFHCAT